MSDENDKILDDPANRVVCTFDNRQQAEDAKAALADFGISGHRIRVLNGEDGADEVDTSAKWFADTDKEIKKYTRELHAGNTVISIPVKDCDCREEVNRIVQNFDARHITHFGEWITEVMG
ncbi:MAG: hypothetical protein KDA87_12040 [Planctomycetales bacterium]|nr:hypothetical protein [Planctomycetales bacterium]